MRIRVVQGWVVQLLALALGTRAASILLQTRLSVADDLSCQPQVDAIRLLLSGSEGRSATGDEEAAALSLARDEAVMAALSEARRLSAVLRCAGLISVRRA